jgi:hypothetical protein
MSSGAESGNEHSRPVAVDTGLIDAMLALSP